MADVSGAVHVFLVGDYEESLEAFERTLQGIFPATSFERRNRPGFESLSDDLLRTSKFIFVLPYSAKVIIYDESDPRRSFHKEIDSAECRESATSAGRDSGRSLDGSLVELVRFSTDFVFRLQCLLLYTGRGTLLVTRCLMAELNSFIE